MAQTTYAYCWADGVIEFGSEGPDGALAFAAHAGERTEAFRALVNVKARHGYETGVLLVPGVPESEGIAAADALAKWRDWAFKGQLIGGCVWLADDDLESERVAA